MSQAYECDFCEQLYKEHDKGCPIRALPQWKSAFATERDYLSRITLMSNGSDPFRFNGDVCPECSYKLIDFLKSLKK